MSTLTPTNIEWVQNPDGSKGHVWNPVTGCTKVSAGCVNCYAEAVMDRFGKGRKFTDVRCHPERLDAPLRRKKPTRIFVNSMSDLWHPDVPDEFIIRVFDVFRGCEVTEYERGGGFHTFMVLTKRPERMRDFCQRLRWDGNEGRMWLADSADDIHYRVMGGRGCTGLRHVWLGVSVENQQTADERIPHLLNTPAAVRFVSYEPAIGPVDLFRFLQAGVCTTCEGGGEVAGNPLADDGLDSCPDCRSTGEDMDNPGLDWVIAGGESGPGARPMHPDWARSVRDQCQAAGVPLFFKQWGEWLGTYPDQQKPGGNVQCHEWNGGVCAWRVGKAKAGHLLDGKEYREWPEVVS